MRTTRLLMLLSPAIAGCLALSCGATEATLLLPDASVGGSAGADAGKEAEASPPDAAPEADGAGDVVAEEASPCKTGELWCDNKCVKSDISHCGACDAVCSSAHGTPSCDGTKCSIQCDADWDDCDGDPANGCEADLASGKLSCGNCQTKCTDGLNSTRACVGGQCVMTCNAGYAHCSGPQTDCDKFVKEDASHCGKCNHSCLTGGTCKEGQCQPMLVTNFVLNPTWLAVDPSATLYCAGDEDQSHQSSIYKVPPGTEAFPGTFAFHSNIFLWGQFLYFAGVESNKWVLCKVGTDLATRQCIAAMGPVTGVVVDGQYIYYAQNSATGGIYRLPLSDMSNPDAGAPVKWLETPHPYRMQISLGELFWTSNTASGTVSHVSVSQAPPTPLDLASAQPFPTFLAVNNTHVFWTNRGDKTVRQVSRSGGSETTLAALPAEAKWGMTLNDEAIYATNDDMNAVYRVDLATHAVSTVTGQLGVRDVVADGQYIYWANYDENRLIKQPK